MAMVQDEKISQEHLHAYYTWAMPFKELHHWLNSNNENLPFENREFACVLENGSFLRYYSFEHVDQLKATIKSLCPKSISLGPVYTNKPKAHRKLSPASFHFLGKELVFDIDIDAYDNIRQCCSGHSMCTSCWKFLVVAIKVVDRALQMDFGFRKILWVYSGRRGVHCWVCDDIPLAFTRHQREAILHYLTPLRNKNPTAHLDVTWDSSQELATREIQPYFQDIVEEQHLLESSKHGIIPLIPHPFQQNIQTFILKYAPERRLEELASMLWKPCIAEKYPRLIQRIQMAICHPRFDQEVTVQENHLLRLPFSIHPQTGRVCIPIYADTIDMFDPFSVPTVGNIFHELQIMKEKGKVLLLNVQTPVKLIDYYYFTIVLSITLYSAIT